MRKFWSLAMALAAAVFMLAQPASAGSDRHVRKAHVHTHMCRHHHHHHHEAVFSAYRPVYAPVYAYRIYEIPRYSYRPYMYSSWSYPYSGVYLVPGPATYRWGHWRDDRW